MSNFKNILIVDDDAICGLILNRHIHAVDKDIDVTAFENGGDALQYLKADQQNPPDLILLDVNLVLYQAWEWLQELKEMENPQLTAIPVIVFSGAMFPEHRRLLEPFQQVSGYYCKDQINEKFLKQLLHTSAQEKYSLMIVNRDIDLNVIYHKALKSLNFMPEMIFINNPESAFIYLSSLDDSKKLPDSILINPASFKHKSTGFMDKFINFSGKKKINVILQGARNMQIDANKIDNEFNFLASGLSNEELITYFKETLNNQKKIKDA